MADKRSSQQSSLPQGQGSGRRSQPGVWTPYSQGGIGIIPRRNVADPGYLRTRAALSSLALSSPLRLLMQIIDSDVDCSLAADNIITLTTGDVQIVAQPVGVANAAPDATGTARIDELLKGQAREIGGLEGLQSIGTLMSLCTGMSSLEAVAGEPLAGVARLWPVDSLSLMMARANRNADAEALQRQNQVEAGRQDPDYPGYARMDPTTFFWKPYQPAVDDPYGRASFGPALAEILSMAHILQALRDCVDHTAWPRGVVEVDTTELFQVAGNLGYSDDPKTGSLAATEWVLAQFQAAVTGVEGLKSDDWMVLGANGKAVMMQGGTFAGLESILSELRSRIIRGLKQLPVMMAFDQGKTEGHTTVQWQVYARRLEAIRSAVLAPILEACNLHLRLLGLMFEAVAKYQPIRTTDALVEAQTKALQVKIAAQLVLLGWESNEQASIEITGNGPVGDKEGDREALLLIAAGKSNNAQPPQAGGTQDEADAQATGQGAAAA